VAAIRAEEIEPGLVAFLEPELLIEDARVCHTQDAADISSRPFVCLSVENGISEWAPTTTEWRSERLEIRQAWRSGGHPQWLRDRQFLNDGANVWRGTHEAFVEASQREVTAASNRARVSNEGLMAIRAEVEAQRHRRTRPCVNSASAGGSK
jgi:hypothetical protein